MLFTIGAVVLFIVAAILAIRAIFSLAKGDKIFTVALAIASLLLIASAWWTQTHRIINTQYVGVTRSTFNQELDGLYQAGLVAKPFFGGVFEYPASSNFERCEQFTPAIKGSYGITLDLCLYYDTGNVDWMKEINRTGSLDANQIMSVWRNGIVKGS